MLSPPSSPVSHFIDSSPESSPIIEPVDSSPPSSPSLQPISLSPPVSPGPAHPFAASTKGVKPPRLYEKRNIYISEDDSDDFASGVGSLSENYAPYAQPGNIWSTSPRKKRTPNNSHVRTLSGASTSSSVTEIAPGRPFAPRQLLFGVPRVSQRSTSTDSRDELSAINLTDDENPGLVPDNRAHNRFGREQAIWDSAITKAVDSADGLVDLQQEGLISPGLSFIPASVADLASLVVLPSKANLEAAKAQSLANPRIRPIARATTFPAKANTPFLVSSEPTLPKATSMNFREPARLSDTPHVLNEVNLLLGNNAITKLPVELFSLHNLTVLSMRNNLLTFLPPQIALLTNLRELNVAQNKLTYLPAEMLEMELHVLVVDHNPWLQHSSSSGSGENANAPPAPRPSRRSLQRIPRRTSLEGDVATLKPSVVSRITARCIVPSLTECCLRVLFAPHSELSQLADTHAPVQPRGRVRTRLEATYELPLSGVDNYPPGLVKTLRACVPQAVAKPDSHMQASPSKRARRSSTRSRVSSTLSDVFGPAPADCTMANNSDDVQQLEETHSGIGTCMSPVHPRHVRPVFVEPTEERFVWVRHIAGRPVHEDVPVLWRGCMPGCLKFLDEESDNAANGADAATSEPPACSDDELVLDAEGNGDDVGLVAIDLAGGLGDEFD
ncbi:hypothetical protein BC835DRAFT_1307995 [Cytidiella melzeri]|nr:hypothetical protein BC835DRAFT_1307995 [Cytidiella melzeri]